MTLIQAIAYGVLIIAVTFAAWLVGREDGKRRGYKTGYEDGKEYVRATPEYREFLITKAVDRGYLAPVKVETRPVEHLHASMMVGQADQMYVPPEAVAEAVGRELKKRLLEALAPYWTITHEYVPKAYAYRYDIEVDVLRKE